MTTASGSAALMASSDDLTANVLRSKVPSAAISGRAYPWLLEAREAARPRRIV